jgi:hypothetical protein
MSAASYRLLIWLVPQAKAECLCAANSRVDWTRAPEAIAVPIRRGDNKKGSDPYPRSIYLIQITHQRLTDICRNRPYIDLVVIVIDAGRQFGTFF